MGDMADFALDNAMDDIDAFDRWERNGSCPQEGYDLGILNEHGGIEELPDFCKSIPKTFKCKFCGEAGLEWHLVNGTWRLHNSKGIHFCEAYSMKKFLFKNKSTSIHKPIMDPPVGLRR